MVAILLSPFRMRFPQTLIVLLDVSAFLDSIDMGSYKKHFRAEEINGESLMDLNEADLLALKMNSSSERYARTRALPLALSLSNRF